MFEFGLSGRLWPIHCKPHDNEVLSSWLVRLSLAYGAQPTYFYAQLWPHNPVWRRDIDKGTDTEFLEMLALKTATSRRRVLATTARGYPGYRFEDLMAKPQSPWLLYQSVRFVIRRKPWLQYCPHCLQSDPDPYFRRFWRLAFITVCPEHHRCLLDRCAHCHSVVNFYLLPGDTEALTLCQNCRYDMRLAQTLVISESMDNQRHLLQLQAFLLETLTSGWCQLRGLPVIRSGDFFDRLRQLILRFLTTMHTPLFRDVFTR